MAKAAQKYLENEEISFQIETDLEDAYDFANRIGFLRATSLSKTAEEDSGYYPITTIDIRERRKTEEEKGAYYDTGDLVEMISRDIVAKFLKGESYRLLAYMLRECIRNAPEHGKTFKADICMKVDGDSVEFAVADEGMGVFESLRSCYAHRQYLNDNQEALKWAIKPGISASFNPAFGQKSKDV